MAEFEITEKHEGHYSVTFPDFPEVKGEVFAVPRAIENCQRQVIEKIILKSDLNSSSHLVDLNFFPYGFDTSKYAVLENKGIGSAVYREIEGILKKEGVDFIFSKPTNVGMERILEKNDFKKEVMTYTPEPFTLYFKKI